MPRAIKTPPGTTYAISRRTQGGRCILRSTDPHVAMGLLYMLFGVADLLGIEIHAMTICPNGWEMVLTDFRGVLPRLFEIVHGSAAMWLKKLHNLKDPVWRLGERVDRRILGTRDEILEHTARILAAPVHAGLVKKGNQYNGFTTRPRRVGERLILRRVAGLSLSEQFDVPDEFVARTTCPPQFGSLAEFRSQIIPVLAQSERRGRANADRPFAGPKRIAKLDPLKPLTQLATIDEKRSYATDVVLVKKDRDRHLAQCAEQRRWYREEYSPAWHRYRQKRRDTVFPTCTYWRFFIENLEIERPPPDAHLFV